MREERDGFDLAGRDQPQTRSLSPPLFLCRHGETTLNAGGRLRGHSALEDVNAAWGSVDNAPGVEPWESVLDRARVALAEAGTRAMDGPVVLVSHDAINSALLAFLEPTRWSEPGAVPQPTGCLNILQREGDTWAVVVAGRPPPLATRDVVGT